MKSINKFLIDNGYHSNTERITILEMVKLVDEWQGNRESENKELETTNDYLKRQNIDVHNEIKPLLKQNKQLIESIEALLILVDPKLSILSSHETHIWNETVRNAKELINQNKS